MCIRDSINYWVKRNFHFESEGRRHDENESDTIDSKMKRFLKNNKISFVEIDGRESEIKVENILLDLKAKKHIE